MRMGAPVGTASTTDEGRRKGSEQLRAMSPSLTALLPITVTVFDPNTMPMNGLGMGVGTGAGVGTISKWMSMPSTGSKKLLASTNR